MRLELLYIIDYYMQPPQWDTCEEPEIISRPTYWRTVRQTRTSPFITAIETAINFVVKRSSDPTSDERYQQLRASVFHIQQRSMQW